MINQKSSTYFVYREPERHEVAASQLSPKRPPPQTPSVAKLCCSVGQIAEAEAVEICVALCITGPPGGAKAPWHHVKQHGGLLIAPAG
jgi:hypothetical protein